MECAFARVSSEQLPTVFYTDSMGAAKQSEYCFACLECSGNVPEIPFLTIPGSADVQPLFPNQIPRRDAACV